MEEEVLGKAYDARLMRRLVGYMKPYRALVALSIVFLFAQSLFQVLGPLLTRTAVDRYLQPNPSVIPAVLPMWKFREGSKGEPAKFPALWGAYTLEN